MVDKEKILNFFNDLSEEETGCLTEVMQMKRVSAGELIFEQDNPGGTLYGIVEGKASVYCLLGIKGLKDHKQILKTLSKGEFFGLLSFFDLKKHSAYVKAEQDCLLIFLEKEQFDRLVETNPEIGLKVIKRLLVIISSFIRQMDTNLKGMMEYYYG